MKDRIQTLLLKKHLSPNEFANRLSMNRSNVSHLLSGRSKLSIDNLSIFMKEFPDISMEWLLLGEGNMLKDEKKESINEEKIVPEVITNQTENRMIDRSKPDNIPIDTDNEIEKIIIFYKDKTCKVYNCK